MTIHRFTGIVLVAAVAVGSATRVRSESRFAWNLPRGFPTPRVPANNPMTPQKVALGRHLFYDTRLSSNGTQACATCHEQARAFTYGRARAVGSTGELHPRSSMSLANVGYAAALTWSNPEITQLEDQALVPMFGDRPVELGWTRPGDALVAITVANVTRALASFERTVIFGTLAVRPLSFRPRRRRHPGRGETGRAVVLQPAVVVLQMHNGFTFSGAADFDGRRERAPEYQNNGATADSGLFKAPTLRNVAITAPYMHDGSIPTLEAVIDAYAAGGHNNPNKHPIVRGFILTTDQKRDLIAFLNSPTDEALLHDPALSNPWTLVREEAR
jgi:cytochrome c peroxidase